jgi:hypothetical protein
MIQYVKRKDLEVLKYDDCIENAMQSRIYAYSWYLDIVADNWDVLVLNDYEAVMPIPWNKKYFIKYITQPYFCQQLGVFSKIDVLKKGVKEFIDAIPKEFRRLGYQFNSDNLLEGKNILRQNYILNLQGKYEDIRSNYRKDRKYRINQANKKQYKLVNISSKELIAIFKQYYSFSDFSNKEYNKLEALMNFCLQNKESFILGVEDENKAILGGSFFIKSNHRIYYIFSAVTSVGKQNNAASLMIDRVVKKYSENTLLLDFEGSMIAGIASFYKSFGANPENYILLIYNRLPFVLNRA